MQPSGGQAILLANKIKAYCASGATLYSSYTYSPSQNVTVAKPDSPIVPAITLTYSNPIR